MKYFGTDGLRGPVGEFPFLPEVFVSIGHRLGLKSKGPVVIGRDTRESGPWILSALATGILSSGKDVWDLGVCPTAVVSRVTSTGRGLGVVISASHNPAKDNGIKILESTGSKAAAKLEQYLEQAIHKKNGQISISKSGGVLQDRVDLVWQDMEWIQSRFANLDLSSLRIAVDTAHGAASEWVPYLLLEFGAKVVQIGAKPNGKNINQACGSMHVSAIKTAVKKKNCDFGFTFDGDADRCLLVSAEGQLIDGDALLAILVNHSIRHRHQGSKHLVGTLMTNQGLQDYLQTRHVKLYRTAVGDKHVVAKMRSCGAALGGENSGHVIIKRHGLFGDGLITMFSILEALSKKDFHLKDALDSYVAYPQVLINVPVGKKIPFHKKPQIRKAALETEKQVNSRGRLLLRYSGTENLARIMIESDSKSLATTLAKNLAKVVQQEIG